MIVSYTMSRVTIRDLYPDLSQKQLQQAEYNLQQYLELILRIYERLEADETLQLSEERKNR